MNKHDTIKDILNKNKDGFTISFNDLKPYSKNKGYSVSLTNIKGKNINNLIKKVLLVGEYGFKDIKENIYIGGWFDNEHKTQYLDLSIISNNKSEVKFFLKRFKQICCFCFKDFKTYTIKDL
jgi:isocitrate lyase